MHAKEVARSIDLSDYDGIVCVSGDGILVEVSLCTMCNGLSVYLNLLLFPFFQIDYISNITVGVV